MALNERPIPEAALRDKDAVEMLRVWIAEGKLHCSIKAGMYIETMKIPEEKAWGTILADVARHVATALESGYGANRDVSLGRICEAFESETTKPTSPTEGNFIKRH
jgi:hypothetical protein